MLRSPLDVAARTRRPCWEEAALSLSSHPSLAYVVGSIGHRVGIAWHRMNGTAVLLSWGSGIRDSGIRDGTTVRMVMADRAWMSGPG